MRINTIKLINLNTLLYFVSFEVILIKHWLLAKKKANTIRSKSIKICI